MLTAVVQFGVVFRDYMNLTDAVRSGTRVAAISRTATDPVATAKAAVVGAGGGITIDPAAVTVNASPGWQPNAAVTVSASYPYSFTIFGIPVYSGSLVSSSTQRVE